MIFVNDLPIEVKHFSDGAIQVSLTKEIVESLDAILEVDEQSYFEVVATIKSNDDLIALLQTKACLDAHYTDVKMDLTLNYVPYQRSDRMMSENSCGGFKVIAPLINSLNAVNVQVLDPHSDVVEALLNNVQIHNQSDCIELMSEKYPELLTVDYLISPDSGALKKALKVSEQFQLPLIEAVKVRELGTNKILRTTVHDNGAELVGKRVLIIDDIGEYGTTHRELARVLKEDFGVSVVNLYVTHGVFPLNKRLDTPSRFNFPLDFIDQIYCLHLWKNDHFEVLDRVTALEFV